jgi:predicted nucleotidyltransferase
MLVSLILYGSRARGDHRQKSDVDLLGVIEEGAIRTEFSAGGTSLYRYPSKLLMENSRKGDLFVLHLITEGIVIHDSFNVFKNVKECFQFKDSYSDEIATAYIVVKFFESHPQLLRQRAARKRLVWGIRTILIARCAERRQACFSSDALARVSGISALRKVVDDRNQADFKDLIAVAKRVAKNFGEEYFIGEWPASSSEQRKLMEQRGGLAADTLKYLRPVRRLRFKRPIPVEPAPIASEYL